MNLASASPRVTGGASGPGLATARRLVEGGARTVLVDLPGSDGAAAAAGPGGLAWFCRADVTDAEAVPAAVRTAAGQASAAARELAAVIAANGPQAVRATKRILVESPGWDPGEAFARQSAIYEPIRASADACEVPLAFREKRPPRWQGC